MHTQKIISASYGEGKFVVDSDQMNTLFENNQHVQNILMH